MFSLRNQCPKKHPESGIWYTSACGRFRVWLHFMSEGGCLQIMRTLDMERRLPLLFAPFRELIKCCTAAAPSIFTIMHNCAMSGNPLALNTEALECTPIMVTALCLWKGKDEHGVH